ncbi:SgcJ/EcaC family oxidoreductase [Calothrix sp. UHCC 0171]|uniref:SgcJ/EcaC family oxidoreductase n=1 Tax=Calothrix sp. UHCC 0171 TaxID=3110245 RepID=UPI002B20135C|nr:SgcJ/EcaC family oxidoreductase [Calothrix sp. UHCC 0171]MEA5571072.1 SgcJ/EcaC family oxidoreductase [Calothrix sp. UHCC 0171]
MLFFSTWLSLTLVLNLAIASTSQNPKITNCIHVTEDDVKILFDRWNNSLRTRNPDIVVSNYAKNAILLPTLSNHWRTSSTEIREYFVKFLENHPIGKIDNRIIKLNCNSVIDTGFYTFTFTTHGKKKTVLARYSFVYEYMNGKWLIVSHHSSKMPES